MIWSVLALGATVMVAWICVGVSGADAASSGKRLVTIHDQSSKKVVVTTADTVGRALEQADVTIRPDDNVDPKTSTKLQAKAYQINIYRAQPVLVIDGNARHSVMTSSETPKQIADSADIPYYDEDEATLSRSDNILDSDGAGLQLKIHRATKFNLVLYGKPIEARTQAKTVGAMLQDKGIKLAANDTVSLPLQTAIKTNLKVQVWRNGKQTINEEKPIAFPVQQIQDADQPVGYKKIKTAGVLGKKNVTYEVVLRNGQEKSRRVIQQVVILEPKQQVEIVGAKPSFSGDFAAALAKLRSCEGGYSSWNPAGPYYGAYQFNEGAWNASAPPGAEYGNASPAEQDQAARNLYVSRGWSPWPNCGASLPDIYR